MSAHTPGPWRLAGKATVKHGGVTGGWIADVHWKNREANAALIVAAPDLFFALRQIVNDLPEKRDWLDPDIERLARAAIAAANGSET